MTAFVADRHSSRGYSADQIPALSHSEAKVLADAEYERLLDVLEQLEGDDWRQPTYCTEWDVRKMVAHLSGACAAYASWGEFRRQLIQNPYMREAAESVDGINKRQIEDRAEYTTTELVDEFRRVGQAAIRTRQKLPAPIRAIKVPFGPPLGFAPIGYLTDTIYTRDQWMHRYDLCAATGKQMIVTPEHDGRIIELVISDLAKLLKEETSEPVELELVGEIGGIFRFGGVNEPQASIRMDMFDFSLLASDRVSPEAIMAHLSITGDQGVASQFIARVSVPF